MASISLTEKDTWKSCSRLRHRLMWVRESHLSMVSIAVSPSMDSGSRSSTSAMICLIRSSMSPRVSDITRWGSGAQEADRPLERRDFGNDLHPFWVSDQPRGEVQLPGRLATRLARL